MPCSLTNSYRHFGKSAAWVWILSTHEVFVCNCFRVRSLWWKKACVHKALGQLVLLNQRLQLNKCNVCTKCTDPLHHTLVYVRMCSVIILFHFYVYRRHFQLEIDHKRQILRNVLWSHNNVNKKLRVNTMKLQSRSGRNGEGKSPVRLNIRTFLTGTYIYIYIIENKTRNIYGAGRNCILKTEEKKMGVLPSFV